MLNAMTEEIVKSSEIEGERLNSEQVRSSLAHRLNINVQHAPTPSHHIDGIVETLMDATSNYRKPLTKKRLFGWHAALFPTGWSGMRKIRVGKFRSADMRIVSNKGGREIVHYEAPEPQDVGSQMDAFLDWFNKDGNENTLLKSAIAHLWFVIVHPFDDGNGRLTRTITEMALSRSENTPLRFYSMSAQIQKEKKEYYRILEVTTTGGLDITAWLKWFLGCLARAVENAEEVVGKVLEKAEFWQKHSVDIPNATQRRILNLLFDGFEGNLTSGKVEKICNVSQDTATRLLKDLLAKGFLDVQGSGRTTHYVLKTFSNTKRKDD
jgi:Fic family protein